MRSKKNLRKINLKNTQKAGSRLKKLKKSVSPARKKHRIQYSFPSGIERKDITLVKCLSRGNPDPEIPCPQGHNYKTYLCKVDGEERALKLTQFSDDIDISNLMLGLKNRQIIQDLIIGSDLYEGIYTFNDNDKRNNFYISKLISHGKFFKNSRNRKLKSQIIDTHGFIDLQHENHNGLFSVSEKGDDFTEFIRSLDVDEIVKIINNIRVALNFMHSKGYAYFDLKIKNIIRCGNGRNTNYKLINFNSLRRIESFKTNPEVLGSPMSISPEMFDLYLADTKEEKLERGKLFDPIKHDTFCFGMLILYLLNPDDFEKIYMDLENPKTPLFNLINYGNLEKTISDQRLGDDRQKKWLYTLAKQYVKLEPDTRFDLSEEIDERRGFERQLSLSDSFNGNYRKSVEEYSKRMSEQKNEIRRRKARSNRINSIKNSVTGVLGSIGNSVTRAASRFTSFFL